MSERIIKDETELETFAESLLEKISSFNHPSAVVIALSGDLGSGKTTFVQKLAATLGVTENITSPTFVLEKRYKTNNERFTQLIHIDLYRIKEEREIDLLSISSVKDNAQTLFCIEWADMFPDCLPNDNIVWITFSITDQDKRRVEYQLDL